MTMTVSNGTGCEATVFTYDNAGAYAVPLSDTTVA